ncbi:hypothetical protein EXIGLDRAFT_172053 [Exidia glandulosa HHB12029]|uniref:Uncharacterized protein n=1 Tax=Exidia glandulosa HHB12029 TaxID=1314781 RepID=A0A165FAQ0_EXIGL|nr:hypothetical protein EXIGLDRAFT_172053 [Exidia glandulosa HHB12029]
MPSRLSRKPSTIPQLCTKLHNRRRAAGAKVIVRDAGALVAMSRRSPAMKTEPVDPIEAVPGPVKKEEELELPTLAYLDLSRGDLFSNVRHRRFPGNEDGKLLDYGIRFHLLLATLQEYEELTKFETQEFQDLSDAIRERASRLPPGGTLAGRDNFGREYVVVGRFVWTYSMIIEKREYSDGIGEEIWFSLLRDNYFYFKPDGGFYGHYVLKDGSVKAIKLSRNQIKRYSYPPDTYMSQKGFQAERF